MSQPTWIGYSLSGRYRIERLLGQGGMSAVYQGADPNLRRTVAVKLIHPHLASDLEFVRRFEEEAAAVAQLRHPNIVQVYDFNHDGGAYYMVLEFVPGETLQRRLKTLSEAGQRLPLEDAVRIMSTICDAVAYAHAQGMIHRDLKPGNVMLHPQGQPILMDFGVAKIMGGQHHTATGAIIGTPQYMSPEQVRGERLDYRADIYSLGVMLYEMSAGKPPFEADSAVSIMLKHVNEPVPDIRQSSSEAPAELKAVIDRALAKNAGDRFQSAAEMAQALRAIGQRAQPSPATLVLPPETAPAATPITAPLPSPATPVERPASAEAAPASTVVGAGQPAPAQPATLSLKRRMPAGVLFGLIGLVLLLGLGAGGLVLLPLLNRAGTPTVEVQPTARPTSIPPTETSLPQPSATLAPTTAPTLAPTATEPPAPTTEPTATSILTPEGMVLIPAGTFNMGSDRGRADERPVHAVTLPAFFMDQYEVTNARYEKCVAEQGCAPPANTGGFTRSFYFGNPEFANHPAIFVSWEQAEAFCQWEGKRLPTEAEWEYSASGGDGRRYPWGDTFDFNLLPVNSRDTVAVGSFPGGASPFGVYDMAGNVGEWVADRYSATYYRESPAENPPGPEEGNARVYRGGSFGNANSANYTTTRRYNQGQRFFDSDIGFRCVMDLP